MQSAGNLKKFYSKLIGQDDLYENLINNHNILEEDEKKELINFLSLNQTNTKETLLYKYNDDQFGYYLAGFIDADGSFIVLIINLKGLLSKDLQFKENKTGEVRLKLKISQKFLEILQGAYKEFGGYLAQTKRGEWEYDSTNFQVASKLIEYIKWRDCFRLVLKKEHLTEEGVMKIVSLKTSIEKIRS